MEKLKLDEKCDFASGNKTFWRRQFQKGVTNKQKVFDWIFGVILPVLCFSADPAIFKTSELWGSSAYLAVLKPFAYLLSFVSIMALMASLIWGAKLRALNGPLAGLFFVGGIISFGVGIIILPVTIAGLIIFIGVLGFVPFLSSAVYLVHAFRSLDRAKPVFERAVLIRTIVITGLFSLITPAVINLEIEHSLARLRSGSYETIQHETELLRLVSPIVNADSLRSEIRRETDQARKGALADAYEKLTGANIERQVRSPIG